MEDEIWTVPRRKGCCIHQTVMTTRVADDQELRALVADALREIDDGDYSSVAAQVGAMEAVVAQVKQADDDAAAMARETKNRVEKLEKELAELKRELERYRQERRGAAATALLARVVAGAILPDGITSKVRCARDLLNLILGD